MALHKATLAYLSNQTAQVEELKKIRVEFDKIDENKDGVLTREEIISCGFVILGLSKIYSETEALERTNEIFDQVDFNGDGLINFSEFLTVTMKRESKYSQAILKKAFEMFDLVI